MLVTTKGGKRVVAGAPKDGLLHVYDLATDKKLYAASVTTRENADVPLSTRPTRFCPGAAGGTEWNGPAYSPDTNLFYSGTVDWCVTVTLDPAELAKKPGQSWTGTQLTAQFGVRDLNWGGWMTAVDADSAEVKWRFRAGAPVVSGITPTKGGLVFAGDMASTRMRSMRRQGRCCGAPICRAHPAAASSPMPSAESSTWHSSPVRGRACSPCRPRARRSSSSACEHGARVWTKRQRDAISRRSMTMYRTVRPRGLVMKRRHLPVAAMLSIVISFTASAQAPAPVTPESLVAAAKRAAGTDYAGTFLRICVAPDNLGGGGGGARGAAPATRVVPDRATWYARPYKVFDNLYFIGTKIHSSWALTTSDGIIVIDTLFDYAIEPEIVEGLTTLGFNPRNIKYVLISHAHGDHDQGAALLQSKYGAKIVMGAADWESTLARPASAPGGVPKRDIAV